MKRLYAFFLSVILGLSITNVAHATDCTPISVDSDNIVFTFSDEQPIVPYAGVETWYKTSLHTVGSFYLDGQNLTPLKTIGNAGSLTVYADATASHGNPYVLYMEIREYPSGRVLASGKSVSMCDCGSVQHAGLTLKVQKGQKIQVFTKYSTTPRTPAKLTLSYSLI